MISPENHEMKVPWVGDKKVNVQKFIFMFYFKTSTVHSECM